MDDLKQKLRRHFEGQQLPADRVQEILAAGRETAAVRASRTWWRMAAAAAIVLGFVILCGTTYFLRQPASGASPGSTAQSVATIVVDYLSNPEHQLGLVSEDRVALVEWLRQHGGPADFEIPPAMAKLTSFGCQVLEVQGRNVYVICLFLDGPPAATPAGMMPDKKMMVAVGPDGQMMKKSRPLVHLIVAPKDRFATNVKAGERVVLSAGGEWNCTSWTQGDQVYIAAAVLPADRLAGLVSAL